LPAPLEAALVFDTPVESLWDEAYHRVVGLGPAAFTSKRGSA
jgi:putative AlgH/UPF0301 family transcriptional regulator